MRCDQCQFWGRVGKADDWESERVGFRTCQAVRERWKIEDDASEELSRDRFANAEGAAKFDEAREDALRASRAYVQDGSQYLADLVTGPDFFCALFQNKPPLSEE